jgi:hypothetical protein
MVNQKQQVNEGLILHVSYTDRFAIRVELRYLIGKTVFWHRGGCPNFCQASKNDREQP